MNRLRHVAWCAITALALAHGTLHAQAPTTAAPDAPAAETTTPAAATPPAATTPPTEPSTPPPAGESPAADATASGDAALAQRVYIIEKYFENLDPSLATAEGFKPADKSPLIGNPGPGHNGFLMICAALVLFMTLPGLALFYGGLVRRKNVLSVCAQCLLCSGLVAIIWWAVGYSLIFGTNLKDSPIGSIFGGTEHFFLNGVTSAPNINYAAWVSHNVFAMFQMMFAIITPALIIGAIAERMKFSAVLAFVTLWMFLVYIPMAHMVWGLTGPMNGVWNGDAKTVSALDFAGGTVVHMTSGWSALILCLIVGPRLGFGKEKMAPHSMVLCMVGTGMLWVGWYGFNAGSAVAADGVAANAFTTTTLAAAVAGFVWAMAEWLQKGHASILGFCSGIVAGLVVVTPACGFITPGSAVLVGLLAGLIPYFAVVFLKNWIGYDDALDTFGVHAVGGTLGALLTGILANSSVNSNIAVTDPANAATNSGLAGLVASGSAWLPQLKAIVLTIAISVVMSAIIAFLIKATIGLRPPSEIETAGLDLSEHGEEGYIL